MSLVLPPLALYVHMPWCVRKCPYCDFNSHAAPELVPQTQYIDTLLQDLQSDLPAVQERPLTSIFFGGGTPSLFAPEEIGRLLDGVKREIAFANDIEITLEANPGTIEHGRFSGYRDAGINRVSLGAQTFNEVARAALSWYKGEAGGGGIDYIAFPEHLKGRYQSFTQADMSALRDAGYDREFMPVEVGVPRYMEWLAQRP